MRGGSWRISGKIPNPLHTASAYKISYENKKLHKIPDIDNDEFTMLVLSFNPLKTFNGLKSYESLHELSVNKTKIEAFEGTVEIPHLKKFTCYSTPLEKINYLRIMARIAFGSSLIVVNNVPIQEKEKQFADHWADTIRSYIQSGYIITSLNPLRIHNPKSKERKTFYKGKGPEEESFSPDRVALQVPLKRFSFGSPKSISARGKSARTSDATEHSSDMGSPGINKAKSDSQVKLDNADYVKKAQVQFEKESLEKKHRKSSGADEGDVKTREVPGSATSITEAEEILVVTDDEDRKDTDDQSGSAQSSTPTTRKRRGSINLVTAPVLKLDSDDEDNAHIVKRKSGSPDDQSTKAHNKSHDGKGHRKSSIATEASGKSGKEEEEYEYYYEEEDINEMMTQSAFNEAMNIVPPIKKVDKAGNKEEGIHLQKDLEINTSLDSLIPPHRATKDNSDEESRELVNSHLVTSNVNQEEIKVEIEQKSKEESSTKDDSKAANEEVAQPEEEAPKVEEEEEKVEEEEKAEEKKEVEEDKSAASNFNSTEARKSLELYIHIPKPIGEVKVEDIPKKDELKPVSDEEDEEGLPIIDDASDEDNNILTDSEPSSGKRTDIFKYERRERKKADFKLPEWNREKIHFEKTPEIDPDALLFF